MDKILAKLDGMIEDMEAKGIVLKLKGPGGEVTELLQTLMEAKGQLMRSRASFRRARALLQKGHGELVEPEEGGG